MGARSSKAKGCNRCAAGERCPQQIAIQLDVRQDCSYNFEHNKGSLSNILTATEGCNPEITLTMRDGPTTTTISGHLRIAEMTTEVTG